MSHIYQPLMLKAILKAQGDVSRRQIAAAFLAYDQSQLDYYEEIVKRYPTATLKRRGLIEYGRGMYRLAASFNGMTFEERSTLADLCDAKLETYLSAQQGNLWRHRAQNYEPLRGSLRWQIIVRAGGRCEACGTSAKERGLHVDHIFPRSKGGTNDVDNLQALCSLCNIQKLDREAIDFSNIASRLTRRDSNCIICCAPDRAHNVERTLAFGWLDGSDFFIAPRRHGATYANLMQPELNAIRAIELSLLALLPPQNLSVKKLRISIDEETDHVCLKYQRG
jgi:ATP adenylyltransferase